MSTIKMTSDFSRSNLEADKMDNTFKNLRKTNFQTRILYPAKLLIKRVNSCF